MYIKSIYLVVYATSYSDEGVLIKKEKKKIQNYLWPPSITLYCRNY